MRNALYYMSRYTFKCIEYGKRPPVRGGPCLMICTTYIVDSNVCNNLYGCWNLINSIKSNVYNISICTKLLFVNTFSISWNYLRGFKVYNLLNSLFILFLSFSVIDSILPLCRNGLSILFLLITRKCSTKAVEVPLSKSIWYQ